jgi:hydrogenase maturation protein HypF
MATVAATRTRRTRIRVDGVVQGVGFRPYVYRLATRQRLSGFVMNDERGVLIEVEGDTETVASFLQRLPVGAPPLARIESVEVSDVAARRSAGGFTIAASPSGGRPDAPVAADSATCDDCLRELFDPADRRYRYPFINCTNCGPRFTIVRGVPYDRPLTTMAGFVMCPACRAEYLDPGDRRYHAQPNACPDCGPSLTVDSGQSTVDGDPLREATDALRSGAIVAVKGVGGYHLACRADDESAVAALRARKHREERPFALMVRDVAAARSLVEVSAAEEALLVGPDRPIVLLRALADAPVAPSVAPGLRELGLMLPYSPLHHLLAADTGVPLVMTSGNLSDEPIAYRDDDALERLGGIADLFLTHDRPIETRTDDSVVRSTGMLRRSRGHVPDALALPVEVRRPLVACGAELKNTFCLARGARAWVGPHIGDLKNYETLTSFERGIEHFEQLFDVRPEVVAHDLHPDYLSTRYALDREDSVDLVGVQHHHAHLAACLAEHAETGPAVGAIYDGAGYGLDGTVWGGELLVGDLRGFERAGHLLEARLPGGDAAAREPWRMAVAWGATALPAVASERLRAVEHMVRTGAASPLTTSVGRLFDAVAALAGLRHEVTYEGQAAVLLEAACDPGESRAYPMPVVERDGTLLLDARPAIAAVIEDDDPALIAARFHNALAVATTRACALLAERAGTDVVVLSGGVFQNRRLLESTTARLERLHLRVLTPRRLPANDGGISYGQAAVAAARMGAA